MKITETIGEFTLEQPPLTPRLCTDTLALSRFVTLKPGETVCDMGCGNGALSLLLLSRCGSLSITAIDRDPVCVQATRRNAGLNGLSGSLQAVECDWRDCVCPVRPYDLTISNPPYYPDGSGAASPVPSRARARMWEPAGDSGRPSSDLDAFCAAAARVTRYGGRVALVYPAAQLAVLIAALGAHKLEPKRLRLIHHNLSKPASLALLEARAGGRPGLRVEPPLLVGVG